MPQKIRIRKEFSGGKTCLSRIVTEFNNLSKLNKYHLTNEKPRKTSIS